MTTRLLAHAPTQHELERLYHELASIGAPAVGRKRPWPYRLADKESLFALASDMLRYDPRLLSILLQLLLARYRDFNPLRLRECMHHMRWPQALGVLLDFTKLATADAELRYLCDYLATGWPRIDPVERFFLDAERPASRVAVRKLGRNLKPYARWGFIGSERPIVDPVNKRTVGRYAADTRKRILRELSAGGSEFTLAEYLDAVDNAISRQQALKDMKGLPGLRGRGRGRGARWSMEGVAPGRNA